MEEDEYYENSTFFANKNNIHGFFDRSDKSVPGDMEFLKALEEANRKMKEKSIKDIDWHRLQDRMENEIFQYDGDAMEYIIRDKYNNPGALVNWLAQTLDKL